MAAIFCTHQLFRRSHFIGHNLLDVGIKLKIILSSGLICLILTYGTIICFVFYASSLCCLSWLIVF